jgi:hypothetical protein
MVAPRAAGRRIEVGRSAREALAKEHRRRTGSEPTAAELDALVRRYVETEALAREVVALGLDRGDTIVRRRLVQKMELFVSRDRHPDAEREAARLRTIVDRGGDAATLGDPFVRGRAMTLADEGEVGGVFGATFARALFALDENRWSQPARRRARTPTTRRPALRFAPAATPA